MEGFRRKTDVLFIIGMDTKHVSKKFIYITNPTS